MIQLAELETKSVDCAWCDRRFDDVVDLLEHVELNHLDGPELDLDAAA